MTLLRPEFSDLTDSKIRFLEDRKLISPARTPGGYRSFGAHDIEVLRWILTRQRDQFLPLSVIGERIDRGEHLADIWGIGTVVAEPVAAVESASADDTAAGEDNDARQNAVQSPTALVAGAVGAPPPWSALDDERTYSIAELSAESGQTADEIAELVDFGLLRPLTGIDTAGSPLSASETSQAGAAQASLGLEPPEPRYDSRALLVARISREFATYGLGARHLRVIRNAAARDASLFEQGIQPILLAGSASAHLDAQHSVSRLMTLCERLRVQVMGETLHRFWH